MVDTSERVTVRIPQDLLEKLKAIQRGKGTATISDTIREGLERFVDLSKQDNHQLEEFVREGNSVSVDDAVRSAVREYIRVRVEQHLAPSNLRPRRDGETMATADGHPPP